MAKYELLADELNQVTSKPGDPLRFTVYRKGDKVELDKARADELIAAGAIKAPDGDEAAEPGAQTEAPEGGPAEGAGDGDEDKGTAGDGGPDPQATGSTAGGNDGLGNTESTPSSTPAKKTASRRG